MVEVLHTQGLISLERLQVIGCVNMRSIAGLWGLPKLEGITIEGCLNLTDILVVAHINECANLTSLRNLRISGCYQLRLLHHVVVYLPKLRNLRLTLNDNFLSESFENNTKMLAGDMGVVNAKTSPALFLAVKEKARNLVNTIDHCSFSFHKLSPDHDGSSSFLFSNNYYISHDDDIIKSETTVGMCFVSTICTVYFPMHIRPPATIFNLPWESRSYNRFDFGEEIHMATFFTREDDRPFIIVAKKQINFYPSYEASVKDGWMIRLRGKEKLEKNKLLAAEVCNIFYSELIKQRFMSRAWTRLPFTAVHF